MESESPKCEKCGATGHGVEFNIFGPYPFGKYCVPCEKDEELLNNPNYVGSKHHY